MPRRTPRRRPRWASRHAISDNTGKPHAATISPERALGPRRRQPHDQVGETLDVGAASRAGALSVIIVEPATVENDQPRPSRNRPTNTCQDVPSGEADAHDECDEEQRGACHRRRRPCPRRSVTMPATGAKANMPSTCTLITTPMIRSSAPPCAMCSGVITITMIIAACAPAITTIAAISSGRSRTTVNAFFHDVCETTGTSAAWRASWSGSGRSATNSTRPAARMPTVPTAKGPVSSGNEAAGRPSRRAR